MGDFTKAREDDFKDLVDKSKGKKCLQIGVRGQKYAPHWISVDKYDKSPVIDFNYDIHDLPYKEGEFDIVVCKAVLEHVEDMWGASKELVRVLRSGGKIWIEIPFNQPYHPSPGDFWRVTPDGMKLLMKGCKDIWCGHCRIFDSVIYNVIVFYGEKV
jgi:SAM-dependent methyltransferase